MAQYTTILASEFNAVQSTVANVLGAGSGTRGYGSSVTSAQVSAGAFITKAQFDALRADMNVCYNHISGSASGATNVVVGNAVAWANIVTYQVGATYVDTNRDSSVSGTSSASSLTLPAGWGNASTNRRATLTGTFTWASADAMRYFFNQNSYINIYGSAAAGGGSSKSNSWGSVASSLSLNFTKAEYRGPFNAYQNIQSTTAPYSSGTPLQGQIDIFAPSSNTISFQLTCLDNGGDDGDADGIVVYSNVDIDTTFYVRALNLSVTSGVTRYDPTFSWGGWSYATS
jgi:hypothetical protein